MKIPCTGWLACVAVLFAAALPALVHADMAAGGDILTDKTLARAGSPYLVSSDLVIRNGATLSIEAGAVLRIATGVNIIVESGAIRVIGTDSAHVVITAATDATGGSPAPGDWGQLRFLDGTNDSLTRLEHVDLRYGRGVVLQSTSPTLESVSIRFMSGPAIDMDVESSPVGSNNVATDNALNAAQVAAGDTSHATRWGLKGIPYFVQGSVSIGQSPKIAAISPSTFEQDDSVPATVTGTRLDGTLGVSFSGTGVRAPLQPGAAASSVPILVQTDPEAAVGDRTVTLDAAAGLVSSTVTITPATPVIESLNPSSVYAGSPATALNVNGRKFVSGSIVRADGVNLETGFSSRTLLTATLPALKLAQPGTLSITVVNPTGRISGSVPLPVLPSPITLFPDPLQVIAGQTASLTVAIPVPAPSSGLVIATTSSDNSIATVPTSLTIPGGTTSGSLPVTGVAPGTATVTATATGFQPGTARVGVISPGCSPGSSGLVAWWTGDGDASDIVGGNAGTPQNGAGFAPGKVSEAFSCDGVDDYISVANTSAINFGSGDFTIETWVNLRSVSGEQEIFHKVTGVVPNDQTYFLEYSSPSTLRFMVRAGSSNQNDLMVPINLSAGTWYHIAAVRQGDRSTLYLNGVAIGSQVAGTNVDTGVGGTARIGDIAPNGSGVLHRAFNGLIDELSLYNRALSDHDIQSVYLSGSAGKCRVSCAQPPNGMVSWWPGDGSGADTVGGNDGTLNNGATFAPGLVGQSFSFDGVDDVLSIPSSPGLNFEPSAPITTEGWIYRKSAAQVMHLWGKRVGCATGGINYQMAIDETIDCGIGFGGDGGGVCTPARIPLNTWTHVAASFDGTTFNLYVNGELKATSSGALGPASTADFEIGGSGTCARFTGSIDEVRVFSRALGAAEIQAIYAARTAGTCNTCTPAPSGVVSWWPGDGNASDIVGANSGILMGGATFKEAKVGQGFSLDGVDGYVEIPDAPSLTPSSITLDAWVNTSTLSASVDGRTIISKYNSNNPNVNGVSWILWMLDGGALEFNVYQTVSGNISRAIKTNSAALTTGTWMHVAATFDASTQQMTIYVNGTPVPASLVSGSTTVSSIADSATPVRIGTAVNGAGQFVSFWSGVIDEAEIVSRALSASEVQALARSGSAGKCRCIRAPADIVSWWPGEGDARDIVGSNSGTLVNGATFQPGLVGQGFSLDGADDYVEIADAPDLRVQSLTVEAWIKRDHAISLGPGYQGIVTKETPGAVGPGREWAFIIVGDGSGNDGLRFHFTDDGQTAGFGGNDLVKYRPFDPAVWYHVAATFDGSMIRLFVNGREEASLVTRSSSIFQGNNPIRIGVQGTLLNRTFPGSIDEVGIYRRALSPSEIEALYVAGGAGKCRPNCSAPSTGLAAWWPGDGHALDLVDGNNGALRNGAGFMTGVGGQAFNLDGTDDFVEVPNASALNPSQAITVAAWYRPTSFAGDGNNSIVNKAFTSHTPPYYQYQLGIIGDQYSVPELRARFRFWLSAGGSYQDVETSSGFWSPGNWYHVVGTYDGSTIRLYVNGVLQSSNALSGTIVDYGKSVRIGAHGNVSNTQFDFTPGAIDEVQIYDRALSESEIQAIYAAAGIGQCKPDLGTTVTGRVVDELGGPVAGAELTAVTDRRATSDAQGRFVLTGVPTVLGPLVVHAMLVSSNGDIDGLSVPVQPLLGGSVDVGDIVLSSLFGDGADGPLTVAQSNQIVNVAHRLTADASSGALTLSLDATSGLLPGHEVMIIQTQGSGAGTYEFRKVSSITASQLTLGKATTNAYVSAGGVASVVSVPHFTTVTIQSGGSLTASSWDGASGGIVVFRASQGVLIQQGGKIDMKGRGFRGGFRNTQQGCGGPGGGAQGESIYPPATGHTIAPNVGGGGGGGPDEPCPSSGCGPGGGPGGGGGFGTPGQDGINPDNQGQAGKGGTSYGMNDLLSRANLGSGGGEGHWAGRPGGNGGGIVLIFTKSLNADTEAIDADGQDGSEIAGVHPSGAGSGGSILVAADVVSTGPGGIHARGGNGNPSQPCLFQNNPVIQVGGGGGNGRIMIRARQHVGEPSSGTYRQWSGNGHYYGAKLASSGISWHQAQSNCLTEGGYLATIASAEEHAFIFSLVGNDSRFWFIDGAGNGEGPLLGGYQPYGSPEPNGGFRWAATDEPFAYTAWSPGEPNNAGGDESRLVFFKQGGLIGDRWNDVGFQAPIHGYICERESPP